MTTNPDIKRCLNWFDAYARDYVGQAPKDILLSVQGKISHTMRVLGHVRGILKENDYPEEIALAAEVAAILHDVGRFPQLVNSATFDDRASRNHAEEGARILSSSEVMEPFSETVRELILTAVQHHNLGVLPRNLTNDQKLVLEILRDADKLDAIRNNVKYMSPDTPYGKALKAGLIWHKTTASKEVLSLTLNRELIPFESINWSNDFALFALCWIYDLHFPYTYRELAESGNFKRLLDLLPDNGEFAKVKKQLQADLQRFIAQT